MTRSQGTTISVKVPIAWDRMTKRTCQRLRQIVGRDTRIIKRYLGVIQTHEESLIVGRKKTRVSTSKIHKLTMIATKGKSPRISVEHDIKSKFPRASSNEINECMKTAIAIYESYLSLKQIKNRNTSHPYTRISSKRNPRWIFTPRMFRFIQKKTSITRLWMNIRDALDTTPHGIREHGRLSIPVKISPFHENQFNRGEVKAAQVFQDRQNKWWVTFAVRLNQIPTKTHQRTYAVLGVDLGIEKAVCTTLLTPKKVSETRYFKQKEKVKLLKEYDDSVKKIQHTMHTRRNNGLQYGHVASKLRAMRTKRENVAREYDRVLIRQLLDYIRQISQKYTLFVAVGKLKGIRHGAHRGNFKGRRFRHMIHSWAFSRITEMLKRGLVQMGWNVEGKKSRLHVIPENWTSRLCWKCGRKGFRPKQSLFVCSCGFKTNADRNGSLNIARRLIKLIPSLHRDENGLGRWAVPERAPTPNAKRKSQLSKRKSMLQIRDRASNPKEPAAVRYTQTSLLTFGDKIKMSDNDPAVVRTVEILSVTESDASVVTQEKEARTVGGTQSQ